MGFNVFTELCNHYHNPNISQYFRIFSSPHKETLDELSFCEKTWENLRCIFLAVEVNLKKAVWFQLYDILEIFDIVYDILYDNDMTF